MILDKDKKNITVIICCAGMGTRLGIGTTKALVDIDGKPLIIRQLELLNEFDDVRVVVGFDAEKVIEVVKGYRKDVMFVCNYEYEHSGPADSLKKALLCSRKYIITLDGDTIINPNDFKKFIDYSEECIAITDNASFETVSAFVNNGMIENLSKGQGNTQWSGICKVQANKLYGEFSNTYNILSQHLPMKAFNLRLKEINTPYDYDEAIKWFKKGMSD